LILTTQRVQSALSILILLSGLVIALSTLSRGVWIDEFHTHVSAARGVSPTEFLTTMSKDQQPLLHYGLIYLAQAAGITEFPALRSLNILGVLLVLAAAWWGARRRAVTPTQICCWERQLRHSSRSWCCSISCGRASWIDTCSRARDPSLS